MYNDSRMNIKKILANTGWMLFDKVFILLLNIVVTVKVANYYGKSEYGEYQFAVSIVALFEILVTFVDGRVVKKRYSENRPEDLVLCVTLARLLLSFISVLGGIAYILIGDESKVYNVLFIILLMNAMIINLRFGMQNRYEYLLKSRKVILASNIALTVGGLLQLVAISCRFPIISIAAITAFSSLISLCIVYLQYTKEFGRLARGNYKKEIAKGIMLESIPLGIAASCSIIYSHCDSIMIGGMLTKDEVGIYSIALKLFAVVQIVKAPIVESVFPKMIELYSQNREKYSKRYVQVTAILTWICVLGVLFSFAVLPYFFKFFKPEYEEALPVFKIYVISALFMYNAGLRAGHYTILSRGKVLMYSQVISVFLNLALNYYLITNVGLYGAAVATAITQAISLMVSNLFFGKEGREVFLWQMKGLNPYYIIKYRK